MRTVVVTGAASGIGRATARMLADSGDRVIGGDLRDAEVTADLTTDAGRRHLVHAVAGISQRVDAVVACAGSAAPSADTVRLNYFGTVATLIGLRPLLAAAPVARVVVVASLAAAHRHRSDLVQACLSEGEDAAVRIAQRLVADGKGHAIYTATKVAIARWVRRSAATHDWAGAGIALNAVAPGIVTTPMIQAQLDDTAGRARLAADVPMPLRGPASPEEVAAVIGWLAAESNALVTGQVVYADGGADAALRGDLVW